MNRKAFFDALRKSLYKSGLPQSAVNALDAILDATEGKGVPTPHAAYMMATAFHEVGRNLLPIRESLNYSVSGLMKTFSRARISAADCQRLGRQSGEKSVPVARQRQIANIIYGGEWGRKNLGNTQPNDGWDFRGGGLPQTTGRTNFGRVARLVGVDLVASPDRIMELRIAVVALVECMTAGTYTGKKLADYNLPTQYRAARAIINADVAKNGEKIAGEARAFEAALRAAGYRERAVPVAPAKPPVIEPDWEKELPPEGETPVKTDPGSAASKVSFGLVAGLVAAIAYGWEWVVSRPCEWIGFFCGG